MDDGELDFSNQEVFTISNSIGEVPGGRKSMDGFLDEIFKDAHACTHTHTCNLPGPDSSHTHTCFHVHTKILPVSSVEKTDDTAESSEKKEPTSKKRPLGNREAVRKYREKKKARAASLEEEIAKLRAMNQQLLKRLQGQAVLEAEVARLKCLLVDIRGRIDGEIGSFPYQKWANTAGSMHLGGGAYMMNPCNVHCGNQTYCLHPDGKNMNDGVGVGVDGQIYSGCEFNSQCFDGGAAGIRKGSSSSVGKKKKGKA
ncbi:hypothetical protein SAY87_022938 [Trapa incisa]|uniref:BZIP domain-containing protein n=1 Tax=Trapa incisa TaxID=236973 RepID=A0AAN7K552_9MYRT|nr:hypothetical protein SAY87_022938 [Trapa incisa]